MMDYAELEIAVFRSNDGHSVDVRFQAGEDCTALILAHGEPITLDFAALFAAALDIEQYGRLLSECLFGNAAIMRAWRTALSYVDSLMIPLRMRMRLEAEASELHTLCWEALQDPITGQILCLEERILFSRAVDSSALPLPRMARREQIRALVAVANPVDLGVYGLEPIDTARQVQQARVALDGIPLTTLDGRAGRRRATLAALVEQLTDDHAILYLVCHGTVYNGESYLWLEDERGNASRVSAQVLAARIQRLLRRPALVVLAACQSAGQPNDAQAALPVGAMLAQAGIGAVIAMSGSVPMATLHAIMPIFFRMLRREGSIDYALATARAAVSNDHPWWLPVLWTRIRNGKLWREQERMA